MWESRSIKSPEARFLKSLIRLGKTKTLNHCVTNRFYSNRAVDSPWKMIAYAEPYQCHDINITEDNVFSSSWFWLWFDSYTCLLCGTVSVSWHQHYRKQCVFIIMVLVMILFIYMSVMWNRIGVMTSTLQKTMCFHHHGSGYDFIHIRVCYVERYQCHVINITEDNVFSSSWFWLWFYSYTCRLCGIVSVSWHQHYRRQCVFIIMVLVMILFIYVSIMWNGISVMTST